MRKTLTLAAACALIALPIFVLPAFAADNPTVCTIGSDPMTCEEVCELICPPGCPPCPDPCPSPCPEMSEQACDMMLSSCDAVTASDVTTGATADAQICEVVCCDASACETTEEVVTVAATETAK